MQATVIIVGLIVEMVGWWFVSSRGRDVWALMPLVLGGMGVAAVLARRPVWVNGVSPAAALAAGVGSGLVLFLATRAFVWTANHWEPFRRDVAEEYGEAATVSRERSLVLSLIVMVPAEELFFRSLVQGHLGTVTAAATAAGLTLLAYVVANATSRSLPILAGAVVGGALWGALAWWSGGVLASLGSHILWTGAMLAFPPGAGRKAEREVEA
jgi:membrane protease YdiL (CAAX protease family)